jgi:hypothetical protein
MTGDEFDTWLAQSRARSGVPRKVEDENVLLDIAHRVPALLKEAPPATQAPKGGDARAEAS